MKTSVNSGLVPWLPAAGGVQLFAPGAAAVGRGGGRGCDSFNSGRRSPCVLKSCRIGPVRRAVRGPRRHYHGAMRGSCVARVVVSLAGALAILGCGGGGSAASGPSPGGPSSGTGVNVTSAVTGSSTPDPCADKWVTF